MAPSAALWAWLAPSLYSAGGLTTGELVAKAVVARSGATPAAYTQCLALFLGLVSLPPLWRNGGLRHNLLVAVPWWITGCIGFVRLDWTTWMMDAIQYAPNPGFAKMAINLNTVWACIAGVVVFEGRFTAKNLAGVVLSTGGTALCTIGQSGAATPPPTTTTLADGPPSSRPTRPTTFVPGAESGRSTQRKSLVTEHLKRHGARIVESSVTRPEALTGLEAHLARHAEQLLAAPQPVPSAAPQQLTTPAHPLWKWLLPGLMASVAITTVEMGARALTTMYEADAGRFTQAQLVWSGIIALAKMLLAPGGLLAALSAVPWWQVAPLALLRMQSQVWVAQSVQLGPNPGLPKTVCGGLNTVLATLGGVVFWRNRLTLMNSAGVVAAVCGTYLCTT